MTRRGTVSRKPAKTKHRKPTRPKRSDAPKAARRDASFAADLEQQLDLRTRALNDAQKKLSERTRELSEALDQQKATSEVLRTISSSPGELEPVFNAMLENAVRICEARFGNLLLYDGDVFRHVALHNAPQAWAAEQMRDPVPPRHSARVLYGIVDTKQVMHIADMAAQNPDEPIAQSLAPEPF